MDGDKKEGNKIVVGIALHPGSLMALDRLSQAQRRSRSSMVNLLVDDATGYNSAAIDAMGDKNE